MKLDKYIQNFNLLKLVHKHSFNSNQELNINKILSYLELANEFKKEPEFTSVFILILKYYILQTIFDKKFFLISNNVHNVFIEKEVKLLPSNISTVEELDNLQSELSNKKNVIRHKIRLSKVYLPKELLPFL